MKKYLGDLGLLLVAIIWGAGFIGNQIALDHQFTPLQIMTLRFLISALLMVAIGYKHLKQMNKATIKAGIILGIFLSIGFITQTFGLQFTTPSKNAFITSTNIVIVPFIGFMIFRRAVDKKAIISAFVALIGIGVLSLNADFTLGLGDFLTLLCAVAFAFHIFFTGEYAKDLNAFGLTTIQLTTAFVVTGVAMVAKGEVVMPMDSVGLGAIVYLGVFSTTIAFLLQTICQQKTTETKAALILSMEAVFGTIFSVIILHEEITWRMIAGCSLIFLGIMLAELKIGSIFGKDPVENNKSIEDTVEKLESVS